MQHLCFNFNIARAGWSYAAIATALFASTANAVPQDQQPPPMEPGQLHRDMNAAKQNGEEENSLLPHFQFFEYMHTKSGGSCCHMKDGVSDIEIIPNDDPDYPLKIQLTHTQYGLKLEEPIWVPVRATSILSVEHAQAACEPYERASEALGFENTCTPPSFSAAWINDGTSFFRGQHFLPDKTIVPADHVVTLEEYKKPEHITVYCLWEAPQF